MANYVDEAHSKDDKILEGLEKSIKAEYNKAYKEVKSDLASVMSKLDLNPNMSPQQRLALMNQKDRLESMLEQYAKVLADTNAMAVKYINNDMLNVYKTTYGFEAEKFSMSMIDNTAIKKILTKEANPFAKLSIDNVTDKKNVKSKLRSALTTSILKGESIPEMARRIRGVMENSLADSIRIARTETTRVENSARMDVGEQGKKMGFSMLKEWVATSDDRTRPAHADADGQQVPIDEPFIVDGEKLMYPGDISMGASPSNVINCRCTMINIIADNGKEVEALEAQKESLEENKKYLKEQMDNKNTIYSNIWNYNVTFDDWEKKSSGSELGMSSIDLKKEYFDGKINELNQLLSSDPDDAWTKNQLDKFTNLKKDLEEFDKKGKEYFELKQQYKENQSQLNEINEKIGKLTGKVDDTFSQERKDNAVWFKSSSQKKEADDLFREQIGGAWRSATDAEKNAIYEYTGSYSKFNEPLRGIEYGTNKYLGVGNVNMDEIGINYGGYAKGQVKREIENMTSFIEKCPTEQDMWVNRGVHYGGMDKFFQIDADKLRYSTPDDLFALLQDKVYTEYGFMSTSSVRGEGFSGDIKLNIFMPKGTPAAYVEPISMFGRGAGRSWDGISKQSAFGREFETIIQRGSQFRVTKVERSDGTLYIDMDLIGFDTKPL